MTHPHFSALDTAPSAPPIRTADTLETPPPSYEAALQYPPPSPKASLSNEHVVVKPTENNITTPVIEAPRPSPNRRPSYVSSVTIPANEFHRYHSPYGRQTSEIPVVIYTQPPPSPSPCDSHRDKDNCAKLCGCILGCIVVMAMSIKKCM